MPRIYDSASSPLDFCVRCYPKTEEEAAELYGDTAITGEGPDNRGNCFGYDAAHPDYQDEDYRCTDCDRLLGEVDN